MESGFTSDTYEYSDSTWQRIPHRGSGRFEFFKVRLFGAMHFVKRPTPRYAHDLQTTESLRKEFNLGYNLSHPGLVKYMRMENGAVFEEYVDGHTLRQMIDQDDDRLKSPQFLERMCRQLLESTAYLHAHGVVHNDIKPENVMVTRIGDQVKLVDLGCAYSDMWDATEGFTPDYKAPEQGVEATNVYTDIYLIGKLVELIAPIAGAERKWRSFVRKATADAFEDRFASDRDAVAAITEKHRFWWSRIAAVISLMISIVGISFFMLRRESAAFIPDGDTADSLRIEDHRMALSGLQVDKEIETRSEPSNAASSGDRDGAKGSETELSDLNAPDNSESMSDREDIPKTAEASRPSVLSPGIQTSVYGELNVDLRNKSNSSETSANTESQEKSSLQQLAAMMDKYIKEQYEKRLIPDYRKFAAMPWTYDKCRMDVKLEARSDEVVRDIVGYVERLAAENSYDASGVLQKGYAIIEQHQLKANTIKYPKGEETEIKEMYGKLNHDSIYNIYYKN